MVGDFNYLYSRTHNQNGLVYTTMSIVEIVSIRTSNSIKVKRVAHDCT